MASLVTLRADRVQETTNTTGTGTLTLAGAVAGYQSFTSAFSTGDIVEYTIQSGNNWETGIGTFTTAGTLLSRDVILRSSNANAAITVAAGALVWSNLGADTFQSSVQPFRNRLSNGAWVFDQINEGVAYSVSSGSLQAMDGWSAAVVGTGTFTCQRVVDPDDANRFALKLACTVADVSIAAADGYNLFCGIEANDIVDLKTGTASAEYITISFDMKFDVTGVYGVAIHNTTVDRSYIGTVTQNVASANEHKVVTLKMDTTGTWATGGTGIGLYLRFTLAAGSTSQGTANAWQAGNVYATAAQCNFMSANTNVGYIKRIQFEKGRVATPFEETSAQAAFARIQRYYQKSYSQGTAVATAAAAAGTVTATGASVANGTVCGVAYFPVEMRVSPSVVVYPYSNPVNTGRVSDGGGVDQAAGSGTAFSIAPKYISLYNNSGGALTPAFASIIFHYAANGRLS